MKAVVFFADGFEEAESLIPVDLLRRAGAEVVTAALNGNVATSSRGVQIVCDSNVKDLKEDTFNAVVLPGGLPGAVNLAGDLNVNNIIRQTYKSGKIVAAICASPAKVLAPLGILDGRKATGYPGTEVKKDVILWQDVSVCTDGNVITAKGPGCSFVFALEIIKALFSQEEANRIAAGICL